MNPISENPAPERRAPGNPPEAKSAMFMRFGGKASAGAKQRLYCFAHAGGTAATYAPWARVLAPEIEVYAVELPGHGTRMDEQPLDTVGAVAQQVADQIVLNVQDAKPFAFYGHSLGAVIAYETALLLENRESSTERPNGGATENRAMSSTPRHLFVGAARAPHLPRTLPHLSDLPPEAFLRGVQQRYGGIAEEVLSEPELLEMILPPMRADFAAYEGYQHAGRSILSCPITAFAGTFDPVVDMEAVEAWADHTTGSFRLHSIPGDHFFLTGHRQKVLDILVNTLKHAPQVQPAPAVANFAGQPDGQPSAESRSIGNGRT